MKHVLHKLSALIKDENLRRLHGGKKMQYIWDYYKLPITILCIVLYVIGYGIYGRLTHKDTVLYTALVNVNAGADLTEGLTSGFLEYLDLNPSKNKLELYTGLYLTDDELNEYHEYTYASRMKIQATIDGELMDVVLMNKEAFDAFSQSGYLHDLDELLREKNPELYSLLSDDLAYFVLRILRWLGLQVPKDVQLIGFDGIRFFGDKEYICSTIVQPVEEIARMCTSLVLDENMPEKPSLVCLPVSYAYGKTTIEPEEGVSL